MQEKKFSEDTQDVTAWWDKYTKQNGFASLWSEHSDSSQLTLKLYCSNARTMVLYWVEHLEGHIQPPELPGDYLKPSWNEESQGGDRGKEGWPWAWQEISEHPNRTLLVCPASRWKERLTKLLSPQDWEWPAQIRDSAVCETEGMRGKSSAATFRKINSTHQTSEPSGCFQVPLLSFLWSPSQYSAGALFSFMKAFFKKV